MIAAARACVAPVGEIFVSAEPRLPRFFIERDRIVHRLAPGCDGMHIDLDDAGIGRHLDDFNARILRRRIAFDMYRRASGFRREFDHGEQFNVILEPFNGGHENAEHAIARLDGERGAHGAGHRDLRVLLLARGGLVRGLAVDAHQFVGIGQGAARLRWILRHDVGIGRRRHIRQRAQRQPETGGGIARREEQLAATQLPFLALPAWRLISGCVPALHGQHIAGRLRQAALEDAHHARARLRLLDLRIAGIDICWQVGLFQKPVRRVLVSRHGAIERHAEALRGFMRELFRVGDERDLVLEFSLAAFIRDQVRIAPDRLAVLAPVKRKSPARQAFAGIPFALPVMQKTAGREALAQAPDQRVGVEPFGWADRGGVPFSGFEIVDRHEGRLAAHRQAHVLRDEICVDLIAERVELVPRLVGKRLRDARRLADAVDAHGEIECAGRRLDHAGNRCGGAIMWRRRKRQMAFAAHQARRRVEPDPARARNVDFSPGMKIGEIVLRAFGSIDGVDVGFQLDEIARDKTCGEAEPAREMHEQPSGIAA